MKNFIISAVMLLPLSMCVPSRWLELSETWPEAFWFIKNTTDIPLRVTTPRRDYKTNHTLRYQNFLEVDPGDSIFIYRSGDRYGDDELPSFDVFLELDSIYVYDKDGKELREWLKEKEVEERSVFKEEAWRRYVEPDFPENLVWVYDICEDDLAGRKNNGKSDTDRQTKMNQPV